MRIPLIWLVPAIIIISTIALVAWLKLRPRSRPRPESSPIASLRLDPGERHLLLLMIDGLPTEAFEIALARRTMPRLQSILAERPTLRMNAISTFPSATAPSLPELLTGRYVDLEGLGAPAAVHAFDRERRRIIRYISEPDIWDWPVPNLFDTARGAGLSAVTVFEGRWEGPESILTTAAVARAAAREVIGAGEHTSGDRGPVQTLLSRIEKKGVPRVSLVVFNDVDLKGHFHGPGSAIVGEALTAIDRLIGDIVDALGNERTPHGSRVIDQTTIILFGDHGMVPSGRFLDLVAFFTSRGLSTYDASTFTHVLLRERLGTLWTRWPDAVVVSGGSNIAQVYLRGHLGGWTDAEPIDNQEGTNHLPPDVEALAIDLAEIEGVGQVLRPLSSNELEIRSSGNRYAKIIVRTEGMRRQFAYAVESDSNRDPFGYLDDPSIVPFVSRGFRVDDASFHSSDQWMKATLTSRYPAAVPLVPKAFHPRRFTGDLMVTALPGWSFMRSQNGDHGNLERDAVMTPLVLNGPGIEDARAPDVPRLVDVFPTAAVLLGADPNDPSLHELDGRPVPGVRGP